MPIEVSKRLKGAKLWPDSGLDLSLRYNHLEVRHLQQRIDELKRCDDLTKAERELLKLLEKEIRDFHHVAS